MDRLPDILGDHTTNLRKRQHHMPESIVFLITKDPSSMRRNILTLQIEYSFPEWFNRLAQIQSKRSLDTAYSLSALPEPQGSF